MALIRITDLRLRTIVGINDWEREHKQDIVINITMDYDENPSITSDNIDDTVDYKVITKKIIAHVEESKYLLLEKLVNEILKITLEDKRVRQSTVKIDKPAALRFSDSVSVEITKEQDK